MQKSKKMGKNTTYQKRVIDIHSHILPGVDDGAKSIDETIEMLRIAWHEGITDMIVTPHYQSGRYFTQAEKIKEKVNYIQSLAKDNHIPVRLYPGTEVYFRSGLEERLDSGQLATMNGSGYMLVEFSPIEEFTYIRNAAEEILGLGYTPIFAHIERFRCMREDINRVKELKNMGCHIQANAGSITGDCGFGTKRYMNKLLKEHLIDYIGTDAHNTCGRAPHAKKCAELLHRKYGEEYAECVLYKNAEKNLLK